MQSKRNLSLDLLKIISMIMIVILHLLSKGNGLHSTIVAHRNLSWLIETFCSCAVDVYVIISGYFLYEGNFSWNKVFKIWRQVWFYSILFLIIFFIFCYKISFTELMFSIFPITFKENYWFITCYLFMYIASPFLNLMLKSISEDMHFNICIFIIVVFSVISIFLPYESRLDVTNGYSIIWFISLYIISAYLKRKNIQTRNNKKFLFLYFVICAIIFLIYLIFNKFGLIYYDRLYWYSSITVLFSAISLVLYFKDFQIKNKYLLSFIKKVSPLTLGVYLIHENIFVRNVLYGGIFNLNLYNNINILFYFLIILILAIFIFTCCCFIDYIRIQLFKFLNKKFNVLKIDNFVLTVANSLKEKIKSYISIVVR